MRRNTKKDDIIILRVERAAKARFRQWAAARGVSMSEILRAAILALLAEDEGVHHDDTSAK